MKSNYNTTREPSCFKCSNCQLVEVKKGGHSLYACQEKQMLKLKPDVFDRLIEQDMYPLEGCKKYV